MHFTLKMFKHVTNWSLQIFSLYLGTSAIQKPKFLLHDCNNSLGKFVSKEWFSKYFWNFSNAQYA